MWLIPPSSTYIEKEETLILLSQILFHTLCHHKKNRAKVFKNFWHNSSEQLSVIVSNDNYGEQEEVGREAWECSLKEKNPGPPGVSLAPAAI